MRWMMLLWLAAACACAGLPGGQALAAARYANPVFDADFADPVVLRASDGHYYAYATNTVHSGRVLRLPVLRSDDLVHWVPWGDALPEPPAWARRTAKFWAPHVSEHAGRFYLYYSAEPDAVDGAAPGLCLGVATAARPEGPFIDRGSPLQCGPGFADIDPMQFDDPQTGRALLYWGSGFGAIRVRELAADRVSFAPHGAAVELVKPRPGAGPGDYGRLVEGAWVTYRAPWYYLFHSGDNCCGPQAHYAVMVARSRAATGPFEVLAAAGGPADSVILARSARWSAPGHNAVVRDARGRDWMLYHAIDSTHPQPANPDPGGTRRVLMLDPIVYRNGWPTIRSGQPSDRPRAAPAPRAAPCASAQRRPRSGCRGLAARLVGLAAR